MAKALNIPTFKLRLPFKFLIGLLIAGFFLTGGMLYLKASIRKWCQDQNIEISSRGMHFLWNHIGMPGVVFEEVKVKNNDPRASIRHIKAKNLSIQPYFFAFFQTYLKGYKLNLSIKGLSIDLKNKDSFEANTITSDIYYKVDTYEIDNVNLGPLHIRLGPSSTTRMENGDPNPKGAHLLIHQIEGNAKYLPEKKILQLSFQVPLAAQQRAEGKAYSIEAKGELAFVQHQRHQKALSDQEPGARGKINLTIDGFSNFLRHLYEAQLISNLVKNLGSIIGYPMTREDLFTRQKEIFTNAISLDLVFHEQGAEITTPS